MVGQGRRELPGCRSRACRHCGGSCANAAAFITHLFLLLLPAGGPQAAQGRAAEQPEPGLGPTFDHDATGALPAELSACHQPATTGRKSEGDGAACPPDHGSCRRACGRCRREQAESPSAMPVRLPGHAGGALGSGPGLRVASPLPCRPWQQAAAACGAQPCPGARRGAQLTELRQLGRGR